MDLDKCEKLWIDLIQQQSVLCQKLITCKEDDEMKATICIEIDLLDKMVKALHKLVVHYKKQSEPQEKKKGKK